MNHLVSYTSNHLEYLSKICFTLLTWSLLSTCLFSQNQSTINYQAVIRDSEGLAVSSGQVGIRLSICNDLNCDEVVYSEAHILLTSDLGLINLKIGAGESLINNYEDIDWSSPKYLKNEVEISAGSGFVHMGTSELVSVPFARYADRVRDEGNLYIEGDTLIHQLTNGQTNKVSMAEFVPKVDCRDDFLIAAGQNSDHSLFDNDRSQSSNLRLRKIAGQEAFPNAMISIPDFPFVNIRIGPNHRQISLSTDYPIDTLIQFWYEACDPDEACSRARATVVLNNSGTSNDIAPLNENDWFDLVSQAESGDTIDLEGRTILVSGRPLYIGKGICLRNGTIKRAATALSSLAYASESNTNTIVVNDPDLFRERDRIIIVNGPTFQDNSGGQLLAIREIRGDTIESFNEFVFPMDSGATVIHQFPLLQIAVPDDQHLYLSDLLFDGNKEGNPYLFDWRYNHTFSMGSETSVNNCTFKNTPAENIFLCGGEIRNCRSYDLNGSFVHGSCQANNVDSTFVQNNYSFRTCLIPEDQNGHNEGWFTYSANVRYFQVLNNTAIIGGEACFGNQGLDDYDNIFINNFFDTFPKKKAFTHPDHTSEDDISNNTYINILNEQ
ncbi:MAG: hypothetical protein AAGF87_02830 [Bacteroidota bacterium]